LFEQLKRLFKHSAFYGLANLLNKAFAIVLLPIYTRFLTLSEYGILEILLVTSSFVLLILQLGMGSALFRMIIYKKSSNRKEIVSTSFYFLIFSSILIVAILCLVSKDISLLIFESVEYANILTFVFIFTLFRAIIIIPEAVLRIDEKSHVFTILATSNFLIGLILNIIYVVIFKKGIYGIVLANLINSGIFVFIYISFIIKDLGLVFRIKELKEMLSFGLPLVPAAIASLILTMSDRYFLEHYSSFDEVGLYSVGYRLGMLISLFVGAFQMAWPAVMFSIAKEENAKATFSRLLTYFLLFLIFIGMALSIFAREMLITVTTESFVQGYKIVPLIVISYIFYGIYFYTAIGIQIKKKTIYMPIIIGIASLINLFLNYLLIPDYGMMGAAIATTICYALLGITSCLVSLRFYWIDYDYRRILKIITISVCIVILGFYINKFEFTFLTVILKLLLMLIFPLALFMIHFFKKSEILKLKEILSIRINIPYSNNL